MPDSLEKAPKPPRWVGYILEKLIARRYREDLLGNLDEVFAKRTKEAGIGLARLEYILSAIKHIRPQFLKEGKNESSYIQIPGPDMLRNYFKSAWRHFMKDRQFTLLNVVGLSTGLVCTLLIYLWVTDELGFDKFHEKDDRLYQVMIHEKGGAGIVTSEGTGGALKDILLREMPEVEMTVSTTPPSWFQKFNLTTGERTIGASGNFVSSDYFKAFSFPLLQGHPGSVLEDKNNVVISRKLAVRLFGSTDNALNKTLDWKWQAYSRKCKVSGVFENFPSNSSEQSDFLIPLTAWDDILPQSGMPSTASGPFRNFVVLKAGADKAIFEQKLAALAAKKLNDKTSKLLIRNYSDGYLHGKYENGVQAGGRIEYVKLFGAIALFILLIACINFMNLSTAKASVRVKEVGVKKALGAGRITLIFQFLGESLLMSFVTLLLAVIAVFLILPNFNALTGRNLTLRFDWTLAATLATITLITGLISGSYPALYLSRFNPALTLKGKLINPLSELWVRKGLVVFQFTVSVVFIASVLVVYRQIDYIQSKNPGYDKENIIYFEMEGNAAAKSDAFLARLKSLPGIVNASSIQQKIILPAFLPGTGGGVRWEGKNTDDKVRFYRMPVNYDLIETIGIQMAAGRSFSRAFGTEANSIIVNEAAVKAMEIADPVGKTIMIGGTEQRIVGVAKNFHFNSLHEAIRPFILYISPAETMLVMAKIAAGQEAQTIGRIRDFYKRFNPGYSFDYRFLDNDYEAQYASEKLVGELAKYFAVLAIIISCLGLFGLAAFTAERRKKEIGVRKVLGASAGSVAKLLSKDFVVLVLIAILLAFPVAWWLMHQWLQSFAYHIALEAGMFAGAAALMILITLITISFQSVRAALMNPVKSLKSE